MPDEAVVVDADGHTMEPDDLWSTRMDQKRWGDWIPRKVVEDDVYETYYAGGAVRGGGRDLQDAMAAAVGMTPKQFHDMLQSLRVPGGHDPDARVADMDRDVPVAFHPGVHVDTPGACRKFRLVAESENMMVTNMAMDELHGGSGLGQAVGNTVDMIVTLGRLLMGGVCERFPRLRFLFLESGGGWIPTQLERMDEQVKAFPLEKRWLSLLPSEYFRRQCWAGFDPEEWNLAACAEWLGPHRRLWASGHPPPEFHPPIGNGPPQAGPPLPGDAPR